MGEKIHPYQLLQIKLAELIRNTPAGERLLSEPRLAKELGVSRATLREAMRTFEAQGLIRRKQGIGTFVVGHTQVIETGLEVLESIETLADKIGLKVSMGDLHIRQIQANAEYAEALQVELDTPLVHVSRVIHAEKRPVAYLIDILTENILTAADIDEGFSGSVIDLLQKRGSPKLMKSYAVIQAVAADSSIARALEIQRGDVLLKFIAWLYDQDGNVVVYSFSYFLPGYFKFHVNRRVGELEYSL